MYKNKRNTPSKGMNGNPPHPLYIAIALFLSILTLATMVLIFCFSAESPQDSGDRSEGVTVFVARLFYPGFDDMPPVVQTATVDRIHRLVRKTAHFLEYALLGFLTAGLLICLHRYIFPKLRGWHTWVLPAAFCLLYATSDEIHQLFSGRGPRVTDVLIDFAGALFGICAIQLIVYLSGRVRIAMNHHEKGKKAA